MNLRHAAALALVGWYLMIPPRDVNHKVRFDWPLNLWTVYKAYDSADQCNKFKEFLQEGIDRPETKKKFSFADSLSHDIHDSQCIASDDPRLKEPR